MSNEHDDDEIRESIPCVSFWANEHGDGVALCLPVGYSLDSEGGVFCRGQRVSADGGERRAWDHAIAREKARRARESKPTPEDKAAAMLAEVIRERDALREKLAVARHKIDMIRNVARWAWEGWFVLTKNGTHVLHADLAAIIGKDGEA